MGSFSSLSLHHRPPILFQDVAARGLDLPQVTWIVQVSPSCRCGHSRTRTGLKVRFPLPVFQYTPPTSAAEYVHRVGRTARIGGRGSSLLFLTPAETAFVSELANHNIRWVESQSLGANH